MIVTKTPHQNSGIYISFNILPYKFVYKVNLSFACNLCCLGYPHATIWILSSIPQLKYLLPKQSSAMFQVMDFHHLSISRLFRLQDRIFSQMQKQTDCFDCSNLLFCYKSMGFPPLYLFEIEKSLDIY